MKSLLTTVMYHYVRPVAPSAFPRLKALELSDFLGQLDHLQKYYNIISPADLSAAHSGGPPLPARPCLLTFDDGYSDHYHHVFPALAARGMSGLFFAPRSSLVERLVLEVNRIQFTLAAHPAPDTLADELDALLHENGSKNTDALRAAHFTPNRYDSANVAYVKRLLQHVLPPDLRTHITGELFRRHVSADEKTFADELYLTQEQARLMQASGMVFGGHGDAHLWHAHTSLAELAAEVAGSTEALTAINAQVAGGYYCYPFGSENKTVRGQVGAAGFVFGFTVVPELWSQKTDLLRIPRLDTNDLPRTPRPDCPWLAQATVNTQN